MNNIWFTADTHFAHNNIIRHCNRPFSSIQEMNQVIIDNLNKVVKSNDTLYHLGDFVWRGTNDYISDYIKKIKCNNLHLILGNHDKTIRKSRKYFISIPAPNGRFLSVDNLKDIKIGEICITLCHYSMQRWNKCHYGALHLFGHSHGNLEGIGKSMDVGVDTNNFCPYHLDEIVSLLN